MWLRGIVDRGSFHERSVKWPSLEVRIRRQRPSAVTIACEAEYFEVVLLDNATEADRDFVKASLEPGGRAIDQRRGDDRLAGLGMRGPTGATR